MTVTATYRPRSNTIDVGGVHLTERELDVLRQLAAGQESNKAIARALGLNSGATVNDRLRAIFRKLKVRSRVAAAVWAVRNGVE